MSSNSYLEKPQKKRLSDELLIVMREDTEKFSGKKSPELMQCSDLIAQDFLWQFCTVLLMVSAKYTAQLFETDPVIPQILFHNDWANLHNNMGGFNTILIGSRGPLQTAVWLLMWLMCKLTKGYSISTY